MEFNSAFKGLSLALAPLTTDDHSVLSKVVVFHLINTYFSSPIQCHSFTL